MRANKGLNTGPEMKLRQALWRAGIRGYRISVKILPGSPDIAFQKRKVAIFVHGCFWHRCPKCSLTMPKTHSEFWEAKFVKNKLRDERVQQELEELGWMTMVIWECEIKKDVDSVVSRIKQLLVEK
jgi:DNA mismatch endonuclease, patch repair protein